MEGVSATVYKGIRGYWRIASAGHKQKMRVVELGDSGGATRRRSWRIKLTPQLKLVVNLLRFRYHQIDHAAGDVSVAVGTEAAHVRSEDVLAHVRSIAFGAEISQAFFSVVAGIRAVSFSRSFPVASSPPSPTPISSQRF